VAAPSQLVQFTFAGGIDQSIRGEALEPSSAFTLIQNARQDARGGLTKRRGFTSRALTRLDATSRSAGYKLFSHGGAAKQACTVDGTYLDVYSPSAARSIVRGRVSPFGLSYLKLPGPGSNAFTITDAVICGDYYVATYSDGLNAYAFVVDAKTGTVARPPEAVIAHGVSEAFALLATFGSNVFMVQREIGSANIKWSKLDTSTAATLNTGWSAAANLATDGCTPGTFADIAFSVESLAGGCLLLYGNNSGGTNRLTLATFGGSGIGSTTTINTSSTNPTAVALQSDGTTIWAAFERAANVYIQAFDTSLATTGTLGLAVALSGASPDIGSTGFIGIVTTSSTAGVCYVNDGADTWLRWSSFSISGGAVTAGTGEVVPNVWLYGRPFRSGGRTYAPIIAGDASNTQQRAIIADLTESASTVSGGMASVRPVAVLEPGLSKPAGVQCRCAAYGSEFWVPITVTTSGASRAVYVARLSTNDVQSWKPVQRGEVTYLTGAMLSAFDGVRVTEANFVISPPKPTTSLGGTGITGTYRYVAVYEHVDAAGNWTISGVSTPSDAVSPANQTVSVNVATLAITSKQTIQNDQNVRVTLYRNVSNGSVYYKVESKGNNLASSVVTFSDATSDASLAANAKLYAPSLPGVNGGAQDRRPPSGLMHATMYNGMLVGTLGDTIRHSGQDIPGEALWWNPLFEQTQPDGGPFTGVATMDGTLYLFKRRSIYACNGEAPSDNASSGGLGTPRRLAVDVGCIDARSIVVTSLGIFFQSERGIEILTRGQSVEWVGEQIQTSLGTSTVVAATMDQADSLVYFELGGTALVYDLARRVWQSVDSRSGSVIASAVIWDEAQSAYRYAYLDSSGLVFVEQSSSYLESGSSWITMLARTGYVKMAGIQGQQIMNRALLLAKKSTRADVNIAASYDYDATFEAATPWVADTLDTLSTALGRIQVGHDLHVDAEGQAVALEISDATPTGGTVGTGQGATWIALTFEGQPRPNAAQLPSEAR
jgi:hypothetical protein